MWQEIEKKINLTEIAVKSIQNYNEFVREKMITLAANNIPDDIESYVFRDAPAL